MLLGFAHFSPSFSNPTIPAWQLPITFMTISTQPPSSCSFFHTALKSQSFPHEQFRGRSHWLLPKRHEWSIGAETIHQPAVLSWVNSMGIAELPGALAGSTQQQILWWRSGTTYLSCSWSSCSAHRGTFGTPDLYLDFGKWIAGLQRTATWSPKQIIHKRHQISTLCRR